MTLTSNPLLIYSSFIILILAVVWMNHDYFSSKSVGEIDDGTVNRMLWNSTLKMFSPNQNPIILLCPTLKQWSSKLTFDDVFVKFKEDTISGVTINHEKPLFGPTNDTLKPLEKIPNISSYSLLTQIEYNVTITKQSFMKQFQYHTNPYYSLIISSPSNTFLHNLTQELKQLSNLQPEHQFYQELLVEGKKDITIKAILHSMNARIPCHYEHNFNLYVYHFTQCLNISM